MKTQPQQQGAHDEIQAQSQGSIIWALGLFSTATPALEVNLRRIFAVGGGVSDGGSVTRRQPALSNKAAHDTLFFTYSNFRRHTPSVKKTTA